MRQHICKNCGKIFLTDKEESYLCPKCAKESRQDNPIRDRVCVRCGTHFLGYPRSKYCPDCQLEVRRERDRQRRKNGSARPLGSIDFCQKCGKEYVVKSGLQKYCPDCAEEAVKETVRAHKRESSKEYNATIRKERRKERKQEGSVCVVCGKPFTSSSATVTCSPECAREQKRRLQAFNDYKRGRSKLERVLSPKNEKR